MTTRSAGCIAPVCALLVFAPVALAQIPPGPGDWGDAPEGADAYPSLGVAGAFPTCFGGVAGFVFHGNPGLAFDMFWGRNVDDEIDGNAGLCPPPPYELDECWGPFDGDGGLSTPDTYSIQAGLVVPCGQTPPIALGTTCQLLNLTPGGPFEAVLTNNSGIPGFVNVLFDWNQDGRWNGFDNCGALVPEHAIVNLPVPPFYTGLLTGLSPGPVRIGSHDGWVWVRMTVSNQPVQLDWDGSGLFDLGETEDYLLRVDSQSSGEFGDAPEGVLAYPASGVGGEFPTCVAIGPSGYVFHAPPGLSYFGPAVDYEGDGNATSCPAPPYDLDECAPVPGGDAGLIMPAPLTLTPGGTIGACPGVGGGGSWTGCFTARWGADVDISVTNFAAGDRYVNVLVDWDADGKWTTAVQTCPQGNTASEQVLQDLVVPAGFSGPLSMLSPPDFTIGAPPDQLCWTRFTITDAPVGSGWDGSGNFGDGETEDYLFRVARPPVDAPVAVATAASGFRLDSVLPNPASAGASIRFTADRIGHARVRVYDPAGRRVADLLDERVDAGVHEVRWNGRDIRGSAAAPGIYFVRAELGGEVRTAKLVVVR